MEIVQATTNHCDVTLRAFGKVGTWVIAGCSLGERECPFGFGEKVEYQSWKLYATILLSFKPIAFLHKKC